jgi:hypothetical protein
VAAGLLAAGLLALLATFAHAALRQSVLTQAQAERAKRVEALLLTDLCLFTEARYTRHPSQADLHTPFQDHPQSLDHFPSGSLLGPPPTLIGRHGPLDPEATLSR